MPHWLRWLTWGTVLTCGGTIATGATWVLVGASVKPKLAAPIVASIAAALYVVEIVRLRSAAAPDLEALARQRDLIAVWASAQANLYFPMAWGPWRWTP